MTLTNHCGTNQSAYREYLTHDYEPQPTTAEQRLIRLTRWQRRLEHWWVELAILAVLAVVYLCFVFPGRVF